MHNENVNERDEYTKHDATRGEVLNQNRRLISLKNRNADRTN